MKKYVLMLAVLISLTLVGCAGGMTRTPMPEKPAAPVEDAAKDGGEAWLIRVKPEVVSGWDQVDLPAYKLRLTVPAKAELEAGANSLSLTQEGFTLALQMAEPEETAAWPNPAEGAKLEEAGSLQILGEDISRQTITTGEGVMGIVYGSGEAIDLPGVKMMISLLAESADASAEQLEAATVWAERVLGSLKPLPEAR